MCASVRSRLALPLLALSMSFNGCAQWTDSLNVFAQPGEIGGHVEIRSGPLASPEGARKSSSTENEILVFLEPIPARLSLQSRWHVETVPIQTARSASGIHLVTVDQPIRIQNLDSIHHELFTTNTENPLRVRLAGGAESEVLRLASPGLVRLYCALHPEENHTFVASSDPAYSAFIDSGMRFRIPRVRPGRYRVRAASALDWGEPETVEVVTAGSVQLTLQLTPGQSR
jgi:hypothetical protein